MHNYAMHRPDVRPDPITEMLRIRYSTIGRTAWAIPCDRDRQAPRRKAGWLEEHGLRDEFPREYGAVVTAVGAAPSFPFGACVDDPVGL